MTNAEAKLEAVRRFGPQAYTKTEYVGTQGIWPKKCYRSIRIKSNLAGVGIAGKVIGSGETWEEVFAEAKLEGRDG